MFFQKKELTSEECILLDALFPKIGDQNILTKFDIAGGAALFVWSQGTIPTSDIDLWYTSDNRLNFVSLITKWESSLEKSLGGASRFCQSKSEDVITYNTHGLKNMPVQFLFSNENKIESILANFDLDYVRCAISFGDSKNPVFIFSDCFLQAWESKTINKICTKALTNSPPRLYSRIMKAFKKGYNLPSSIHSLTQICPQAENHLFEFLFPNFANFRVSLNRRPIIEKLERLPENAISSNLRFGKKKEIHVDQKNYLLLDSCEQKRKRKITFKTKERKETEKPAWKCGQCEQRNNENMQCSTCFSWRCPLCKYVVVSILDFYCTLCIKTWTKQEILAPISGYYYLASSSQPIVLPMDIWSNKIGPYLTQKKILTLQILNSNWSQLSRKMLAHSKYLFSIAEGPWLNEYGDWENLEFDKNHFSLIPSYFDTKRVDCYTFDSNFIWIASEGNIYQYDLISKFCHQILPTKSKFISHLIQDISPNLFVICHFDTCSKIVIAYKRYMYIHTEFEIKRHQKINSVMLWQRYIGLWMQNSFQLLDWRGVLRFYQLGVVSNVKVKPNEIHFDLNKKPYFIKEEESWKIST